jgi:hypothetical protein
METLIVVVVVSVAVVKRLVVFVSASDPPSNQHAEPYTASVPLVLTTLLLCGVLKVIDLQ